MKRTLSLLGFCALLAACGNNDESPSVTEEVAKDQNITEVVTAPVAFPELFAHLGDQDTSFFVEGFGDFSAPAPLDTASPLAIQGEELTPFRRFLIFNSDSTKAIDPYSYNHLLVERGGKEKLVPGGPDTEVGIVDFAKRERRRLLYFGPSYLLLEARWKSGDTVLFAITEDLEGKRISPEIWEVDLASMTKRVRRYPDTLTVDLEMYRNQKLDSARY